MTEKITICIGREYGSGGREIGEKLAVSVKTADTYKTRVMEKLNFTKKSELIDYALKYGLLSDKN